MTADADADSHDVDTHAKAAMVTATPEAEAEAEEAARFHTLLEVFEGGRPPPEAAARMRSTSR